MPLLLFSKLNPLPLLRFGSAVLRRFYLTMKEYRF